MEADEIEEKVKGWLSKGAEVSRKAIETVGGKVQDFTDRSVIKMEKKQLQSKLEGKYLELGKKISTIMDTNNDTVKEEKCLKISTDEDAEKIAALHNEIQTLISQIIEKDKEIN